MAGRLSECLRPVSATGILGRHQGADRGRDLCNPAKLLGVPFPKPAAKQSTYLSQAVRRVLIDLEAQGLEHRHGLCLPPAPQGNAR